MTQESIVHYHNYYGETTNQHHNGNGDNVGKNKEENNKIQTNIWQSLKTLFKSIPLYTNPTPPLRY